MTIDRDKEFIETIGELQLNLSKKDIDLFLDITKYQKLKNKEVFIHPGANTKNAFFILSGHVRGYLINEDGVEKNIFLRNKGKFMGPADSLFQDRDTKYYFESIQSSEVLLFNYDQFEQLAKESKGVYELLIFGLKENITILVDRLESMISKSPEERYEKLLEESPQFFQSVFHKHIANFLGITSISLSRIIKRRKNRNT